MKFVSDQLFLVYKLNFSVTKNTKLVKLLRKDFTNLTSVFSGYLNWIAAFIALAFKSDLEWLDYPSPMF